MSLIYLCFVSPFVVAYGSLLRLFLGYTNSYTVSLILLALAHIIFTTPFRRLARRLPLDLRGPSSLLMHIPFLPALYYLLLETPAHPVDLFSFLADGRKPDDLLGSIHLLPIIGLALQLVLVSSFSHRSIKARAPGLLGALALGAILYQAPAYLHLFWIVVLTLSILINIQIRQSIPTLVPQDPLAWGHRLIFGSTMLAFALLLCVFGPSMLYFSYPIAYFNQGVLQVLRSSIPVMGIILMISLLTWTATPPRFRGALCRVVSFCATACLLFASSKLPDYGVVDGFALSRFGSVSTTVKAIADITTLGLAALITWALFRFKQPFEIAAYFILVSLTLTAYPAILSVIRTSSAETAGAAQLKGALQYSKSGKNTIIFVLDMFTGTHINQMLDDMPDTMSKFTGFTWYPDTVATGSSTLVGMPGIVGGHSFLPSQMNEAVASTNVEKLTQAHTVLPRLFAESGSETSLINVPFYFDRSVFQKEIGDADKSLHFVPNATQIIYKPDMKAIGAPLYSIAISLFRMSANLLKSTIDQVGNWLGSANINYSFPATKGEVLLLTSLPSLSSATSPTDTFKIIYSLLPHCFYHLQKDV